jgi:hypothetical protein
MTNEELRVKIELGQTLFISEHPDELEAGYQAAHRAAYVLGAGLPPFEWWSHEGARRASAWLVGWHQGMLERSGKP